MTSSRRVTLRLVQPLAFSRTCVRLLALGLPCLNRRVRAGVGIVRDNRFVLWSEGDGEEVGVVIVGIKTDAI